MDASHSQIVKIWSKNCFFYVKKHPIPICFLLLFFLAYMFMPLVYTVLIYSSPLVGFSFLVHRVFLGIDRRKTKKTEQDDKRRKFAKSRRSFKSKRHQLSRRNTKTKSDNINYSDTDFDQDNDDIFWKSLNELLADKTPLIEEKKIGDVNRESVVGRGESSSSTYGNRKYGINGNDDYKNEVEGGSSDISAGVRWAEDEQKNDMDLGLVETERNKRLEGLMQRRRSRKNLGFKEKEETENNNNGPISAIKTVKINPFLEANLSGKNIPGSAPSALKSTHNPFDLPYDPHEEKPDLSGDDFHEEFTVGHHKEAMFSRHQSFSLGAFSHPDATRDMSFYHDLASKRFTLGRLGTSSSTIDSVGTGRPKEESEAVGLPHGKYGTERKTKENNFERNNSFDCGSSTGLDERKADIMFFYGGKKRGGHAPSNSIMSDLQVEVSDEETSLKDLDVEKEKRSWLNLSNLSKGDSGVVVESDGEEDRTNLLSDIKMDEDYLALENNNPEIISSSVVPTDLPSTQEMNNMPQSLNSSTIESNYLGYSASHL